MILSAIEEKRWIQKMTEERKIPQYFIQVFPHARQLALLQSKFHPDLPFVQDPDFYDEYLFTWFGFKPLEHYFLIPIRSLVEESGRQMEKEKSREKEKKEKEDTVQFSFKISDVYVNKAKFSSATKNRRIEHKVTIYLAVSPDDWNRTNLLDPKNKNFLLSPDNKIREHEVYTLMDYSLPLEAIYQMLLMNANSAMALKRESAKRGKTQEVTLQKSWRMWQNQIS